MIVLGAGRGAAWRRCAVELRRNLLSVNVERALALEIQGASK